MPVVYWNVMFDRELSCSVYSITIQSFLDKMSTEVNLINKYSLTIRGIEWSIGNDVSWKISAQSRNLGILNKSLRILGLLHIEPS